MSSQAGTRVGRWRRSLRWRLLAATLVALLAALALSGVWLAGLFRDHVVRQFGSALTAQLDQVTARLEFDAAGQPVLDTRSLSDPRWTRPYSGLYWQVDALAGGPARVVARSRSLWDAALAVADDALADGAVHVHEADGPDGARLLLVERTVRGEGGGESTATAPWRLLVAGDLRETEAAIERFNHVLVSSLAVLLVLMCLAALAQVSVGLAPLRALHSALAAVRGGRAPRLQGRFPAEVEPLVEDFNGVLDRNAEIVARARTQAGNLAHAIKTPLAAMSHAAAAQGRDAGACNELALLVQEQVAVAQRHVDWHLARSRAAAAQGVPGARVAIEPVVAALVRVMQRVHALRELSFVCAPIDPALCFAGELEDLQEMLGNVLDNAGKWARREVRIGAAGIGARRLRIVVEDDGHGIEAGRRDAVMARGARLDESVPGDGLGLAIVQELVGLYGGSVTLGMAGGDDAGASAPSRGALGGLRVQIELPAA